MISNKKITIEWIYPALWGILMYNVLRAITDLTHHGIFWEGDIKLHLVALLLSILLCYVSNVVWHGQLCRTVEFSKMGRDYILVLAQLLISLNLILITGQSAGFLFMGAGWIDYMLINVVYIPLLLIFYTFIHNRVRDKNVQKKMLALEKLKAEKNQAELDLLKSQYHPHFLFNALNTIYFQVDDWNEEAKKSIEHLSGLLRYQLYDVNQEVPFHKEIAYLRSYIAFQQLRKTDKLAVNLTIDAILQQQPIEPLLFQPLLENAFKYVSGSYEIDLVVKLVENKIHFILKNSVSDTPVSSVIKDSGIGLSNLKRRLELLYPEKHQLLTKKENDFFEVTLILQIK
ncbi:sensor histidine kinase [Flavobacterium sp. SLB02]|uniref:sensor histidine kinase n=1 Tax=Flavobacterium sp. SLB02 TaxID=2665645 RepID=UPI0012A7BF46|nr:histidine kinase [Flavobacterium sp. SLB02]QGK74167.1 sensor histidine kinase [Flavobacterium sp. SLB02]